jgi:hypothetical protein
VSIGSIALLLGGRSGAAIHERRMNWNTCICDRFLQGRVYNAAMHTGIPFFFSPSSP